MPKGMPSPMPSLLAIEWWQYRASRPAFGPAPYPAPCLAPASSAALGSSACACVI
eukprot:CAMPEP_0173342278 /NCGR_PEP_ID=MMETSP1144-20121109/10114_2 /TAXON_ID=483371 /ORGANISM="non described non described, Strain CCMP2298" /LENGTH=54 /DNA_ID=CAMNT_0014288845 /DNA_START=710 /DNA_END=874 /DNA_ORIENTATION=-